MKTQMPSNCRAKPRIETNKNKLRFMKSITNSKNLPASVLCFNKNHEETASKGTNSTNLLLQKPIKRETSNPHPAVRSIEKSKKKCRDKEEQMAPSESNQQRPFLQTRPMPRSSISWHNLLPDGAQIPSPATQISILRFVKGKP